VMPTVGNGTLIAVFPAAGSGYGSNVSTQASFS
jgi:hypothetical protein